MNGSFRTNCLAVILLGCASFVASLSHVRAQNLPPGTNIDESKVGTYTLPDPLVMADGKRVRDSKVWMEKRRPEIMRLFEENQYGYTPQKKLQPRYDVFDKNSAALDGKAIRTQVRIRFSDDPATPTLRVLLYTPADANGPVPTLLHIGFSPNSLVVNDPAVEEGFGWNSQTKQRVPGRQARKIGEFDPRVFLDHGFGIAMIYYGDIDPDFDGGAVHGVRTLFGDVTKERGPTEWGTIGSWSWGASRVLDYLQTNARVDGRKVALSGVSRLGKTVLWAGAQDQRFAVIMPLVSGEGGAALSRRDFGETVAHLMSPTRYHYWFAKNYARFAANVGSMPVDAHMLIAMIAPRPILLVTGSTDNWWDPKGEFLAAVAAGPVFELLGKQSLRTEVWPSPDTPILNDMGYFMHNGPHSPLPGDYVLLAKFMEKHFGKPSKNPAR